MENGCSLPRSQEPVSGKYTVKHTEFSHVFIYFGFKLLLVKVTALQTINVQIQDIFIFTSLNAHRIEKMLDVAVVEPQESNVSSRTNFSVK
jgi:hypothetical protein